MTVFAAEGAARTFEYGPRDVGYVPLAMGHYVLNTGRDVLRFLEVFRSDRFAEVSLSRWLAHTPPELVSEHLRVDERVLAGLHRVERPVVR
jgi:oxalate decarboxylase